MFASVVVSGVAFSAFAQEMLPRPDEPFKGHIGRTAKDSTPDFPKELTPPKNAPNVLLILTDDAGFGTASTFGGPIPTPTMDRLAQEGLRFNNFHTTALCSPTRAALITGRNHHSVQTGVIMEFGTGYPGYNTVMSKENGTVAQVLREHAYSTSWYGKNHNVPDWQTSQAGPFDLWPTGLGFNYFYGFIGGDTDQWRPALFEGTKPIEPYFGKPDCILDVDLADHAIDWIRMQKSVAPQKPFFAYYATGTAHAPHHAPKDSIAKFKGKFDQGWDKVREEIFARQKQESRWQTLCSKHGAPSTVLPTPAEPDWPAGGWHRLRRIIERLAYRGGVPLPHGCSEPPFAQHHTKLARAPPRRKVIYGGVFKDTIVG